MKSAWSHLPNAALIDRILADVRARPQAWGAAWDAACSAAWDAAWDAALPAAQDAAWSAACSAARAAWDAAQDAAWSAAWDAARGAAVGGAAAAVALVAWDRASSYLDLPAEQVRILAVLGDNIASLMLPAALALETERELA